MLTETKLFAVHDRMTLVSMLVQRLIPETDREFAILMRAGYRQIDDYFFFATIEDGIGEFTYDPYRLSNTRTFGTAARYVNLHWDELESGELLDCEVLSGEKDPSDARRFEDEFGLY